MAERRLIDATDIELAPPAEELPDLDIRSARLRAERDVIQEALIRSNNILSVAARLLGVSRPTLYGLLEVHGLAHDAISTSDTVVTTLATETATATVETDCRTIEGQPNAI
jgi:two-component system NtrC family response regulator